MREQQQEQETLQERLSYTAFRAAERLAMALPESLGRPLFEGAGAAAFHLVGKARGVVASNLSRVLGQEPSSPLVQASTKEAFRSYGRYWFDTFHARVIPDEELLRRQVFIGREHLERAFEKGGGLVLALPHLGNWDTAGAWVPRQGWSITAVAELLRPERLYRLFLEHRRALGMGVLGLSDDRKVAEECIRLLSENHLIALVADRDLKGNGVIVEMFGEERRIPAGPALLSLATGCPLMAASCYDTPEGWVTYISDPIEIERTESLRDDVTTMTRLLAAQFERAIAAAPTQWHMFQPAWDEPAQDRAGSPASAAAAAGAAAP
ncbi:MAG: phosphatidylinositol mannoside acyltransferase [Actinomycetota bacterium]